MQANIVCSIKDKPEDSKLVVESLATVSGCVTCSTSSAAAESCTLNKRAPNRNCLYIYVN